MTSPSPVLTALRQATASLHQRLDTLIDLERSTASRAAYRDLLAVLLGGMEPVEASLRGFDWTAAGLDPLVASWRSPLLRRDLAALGLGADAVAGLPRAPAPPVPPSRAAAFGALYVIEGAALGGQVIFRAARERLGISAAEGGGFHAAAGRPPVGESWRRFRAALEAGCDDVAAAAVLAVQTFVDLEAWFTAFLPPARVKEYA